MLIPAKRSRQIRRVRPAIDGLEDRSLLSASPPAASHANVREAARYGSGTINAKLDKDVTVQGPAGPIKVVIHNTEDQTYNANGQVNHNATFYEATGGNGFIDINGVRKFGYYTETYKGSLHTTIRYPLRFSVDSANSIQASTYHPYVPITVTRKLTFNGKTLYERSYKATAYFSPKIDLGTYSGQFPRVFAGQVNKTNPDNSQLHVNWNLHP
ncbi:MAG: hypothetical protein U0800_03365 [Isosphaeraceae bacterium]